MPADPPEPGDLSPDESTRRDALRTLLALPVALSIPGLLDAAANIPQSPQSTSRDRALATVRRHVVVIGAGAFGGWTALYLLRAGARVTLVDAWGAGNARASSGGATRVLRGIYNGRQVYIDMVARAVTLWKEHEQRWKRTVYRRTGALWMFQGDDAFARTSIVPMQRVGLTAREVPKPEARRRWPQIDFAGVRSAFFEPEAGYLLARDSCELVRESFISEGGEYRGGWVRAGPIVAAGMHAVTLSDGATLTADQFVFACGPWLGRVFPDVIGTHIRATRQPLVYLGSPPGDTRFDDASCPVWIDFSDRIIYGVPGNEHRGFTTADDTLGALVDPTTMDRVPTADEVAHLRSLAAHRFPSLARAPVVAAEVCQYEYSPNGDFIVDRHPGADNVWLLGGGSGHGFKMGPALGEHAAGVILGHRRAEPQFALARLAGKRPQSKRTA